MNFTAKSRYALKIMMDLAEHGQNETQQRHKIASRQGISIDFMDQIMARLRENHLIASTRGRFGGIKLRRTPGAISLWDIFTAVEDHIYPVSCIHDRECEHETSCISRDAWSDVYQSIRNELNKKTLKQMVDQWTKKQENQSRFREAAKQQELKQPEFSKIPL